MKLNPDCIRDILLTIEELVESVDDVVLFSDTDATRGRLSNYTHDEILYHLRQCELSGYIIGFKTDVMGRTHVRDLSPAGHKFLADIRSDTVWNHTKSIAAKIGSYSLDTLTKISVGVITEMIKKQLA